MSSIEWFYERASVKAALLRSRRLMSFSTCMVSIQYLLPCTARTASALGCDPQDESKCQPCPLEPAFAKVGCCIFSERESNSMQGEFYRLPAGSHPSPIVEGGHAMGLVGFSDVYRTQHGFTGGWILKNSWCDLLPRARMHMHMHNARAHRMHVRMRTCTVRVHTTCICTCAQVGACTPHAYVRAHRWDGLPPSSEWTHARGSHSIAYFLQEVSSADEAQTCPNSHCPQMWFKCGSLYECRSKATIAYARAANQALHLRCTDSSPFVSGLCEKNEPLFLQSIRPWGGFLSVACFLRDQVGLRLGSFGCGGGFLSAACFLRDHVGVRARVPGSGPGSGPGPGLGPGSGPGSRSGLGLRLSNRRLLAARTGRGVPASRSSRSRRQP